jgi:hypothetical protein
MRNNLVAALAVALLVFCNGCALLVVGGAAAAGAGAVYYVDGELKDTESASLDAVHAATLAGLRNMQYAIVSDAKDINDAKILARTATDTKIQIQLAKQSPSVTEIRIRVGTFGDESLSRQILDKIKAHL